MLAFTLFSAYNIKAVFPFYPVHIAPQPPQYKAHSGKGKFLFWCPGLWGLAGLVGSGLGRAFILKCKVMGRVDHRPMIEMYALAVSGLIGMFAERRHFRD